MKLRTQMALSLIGTAAALSLITGCGGQMSDKQKEQSTSVETEAPTQDAQKKMEETQEAEETQAANETRAAKGQHSVPTDKEGEVLLTNRKLNVSVVQMPILDTPSSLEYLRNQVDSLMQGTLRPELVVGVEYGLGFTPQRIDSDFIDYLGAIAKKYGIYFVPGTFSEISDD